MLRGDEVLLLICCVCARGEKVLHQGGVPALQPPCVTHCHTSLRNVAAVASAWLCATSCFEKWNDQAAAVSELVLERLNNQRGAH